MVPVQNFSPRVDTLHSIFVHDSDLRNGHREEILQGLKHLCRPQRVFIVSRREEQMLSLATEVNSGCKARIRILHPLTRLTSVAESYAEELESAFRQSGANERRSVIVITFASTIAEAAKKGLFGLSLLHNRQPFTKVVGFINSLRS